MKKTLITAVILLIVLCFPAYAGNIGEIKIGFEESDRGLPVKYAEPREASSGIVITEWNADQEPESWKYSRPVTFTMTVEPSWGDSTFSRSKTKVSVNSNHASVSSSTIHSDRAVIVIRYYPFTGLSAPESVWESNYVIYWDKVPNASAYEVDLSWLNEDDRQSSKHYTVHGTSLDVSQEIVAETKIKVRAIPTDNSKSTQSASDWTELVETIGPTGSAGSLRLGGNGVYLNEGGQNAVGWQFVNGSWYFFDHARGGKALQNEWAYISEKWYHFNEKCQMETGWITDVDGNQYYLSEQKGSDEGKMIVGWIETFPGRWFWCNDGRVSNLPFGALLVNAKTPDGYPVGANGLWREQ